MEKIKKILRPYYIKPVGFYRKKTRWYYLFINYFKDYLLFKKYSLAFNKKDIANKEADIILQYHGLEKGMLYTEMKKGFAKGRINNLHKLLNDKDVIKSITSRSQIKVGYQVMCKYYELHEEAGYNIESIFSKAQYENYKSILNSNYNDGFHGIIEWTKEDFFSSNNDNFEMFAHSRKSTRNFTGEKIPYDIINKAISLANTAPSVCNRQASHVYLIEDKKTIDNVLSVQGGFTGYTENVNQLLILTNDRKYYYSIGERNQAYIDGGLYLMNLLYSLHYYKIGNCPTHWGKTHSDEKKLSKYIIIPDSEVIICMIPIGILKSHFRTTLSERRKSTENLHRL